MAFSTFEFDTEFAGPQGWAAMYRGAGLQVVPSFVPGEDPEWKRPIIKWREFEDTLVPETRFDLWYGVAGQFRTRWNMGVITGKASDGVFIVDLDRREGKDGFSWWAGLLAAEANNLEPETPSQRTGGGGRQLLFRAPPGWTPPTFKTRIGVDIRGQGGFAMLPPSRHESGLEYQWEEGREPWSLPIMDAPAWLIAAIDKLREEYAKNAGQGGERVEVGTEQNAFGRTVDGREERMANIIWGIACDLRREFQGPWTASVEPRAAVEKERGWGMYLYEVKSRIQGVENAEGLEREGRGRTAYDDRWGRALAQWDTKLAQEAARPKPGPPPKPLATGEGFDPWARLTLPTFPVETLPASQQAFIDYQTASLGADPAGVAMAMLTAISGALDQRFRVKLRRTGDWHVPPRLWTMLVGESATKKTPIISTVLKPLRKIEADFAHQWRRDMAMWEATEKGERGSKPADYTRFILNDATVEVVGEILGRQNRGALVEADELASFIGGLDRYSPGRGSADRAFWLTAYNGGSLSVERISRSVFVSNLCVAFLGGMQPERMRDLSDLMTDGLLQRFNPILIERGPPSAEAENELAALRYGDLLMFLSSMKPLTLQISEAGLKVAEDFRAEAYELESAPAVLGRGFCAWVGKLPGTHGSLSLLLHILENKEEAVYLQIGERSVRNAAAIITEFLIPHGRAFYQDTLNTSNDEGLQRVASFLLTSDAERFTLSDLRYNVRALGEVKTAWEMSALLAPFVSGGWLQEQPDRAWTVTEGLRDRFAERRAYEVGRKAEIMSRFKPKAGDHDRPPV